MELLITFPASLLHFCVNLGLHVALNGGCLHKSVPLMLDGVPTLFVLHINIVSGFICKIAIDVTTF